MRPLKISLLSLAVIAIATPSMASPQRFDDSNDYAAAKLRIEAILANDAWRKQTEAKLADADRRLTDLENKARLASSGAKPAATTNTLQNQVQSGGCTGSFVPATTSTVRFGSTIVSSGGSTGSYVSPRSSLLDRVSRSNVYVAPIQSSAPMVQYESHQVYSSPPTVTYGPATYTTETIYPASAAIVEPRQQVRQPVFSPKRRRLFARPQATKCFRNSDGSWTCPNR